MWCYFPSDFQFLPLFTAQSRVSVIITCWVDHFPVPLFPQSLKPWISITSPSLSQITLMWTNNQEAKYILGFPRGSDGKESACTAGDPGSIPWGRKWQPTPVFLPGEFHGQRSLAGYSPWGRKEQDTTEQLTRFQSIWYWAKLKFFNQVMLMRTQTWKRFYMQKGMTV